MNAPWKGVDLIVPFLYRSIDISIRESQEYR